MKVEKRTEATRSTPCRKRTQIRLFAPKETPLVDRKAEIEIKRLWVAKVPIPLRPACRDICKAAGTPLSRKALIVGHSVQAVRILEIRDFGQNEVGCQLVFDKDRRTLEATIGIFFKDRCVVTARILAAVHHGCEHRNQLRIEVATVESVGWGL